MEQSLYGKICALWAVSYTHLDVYKRQDLLSLVKMDKKAADVNITHMDINQLLEDILKRLRPIADLSLIHI